MLCHISVVVNLSVLFRSVRDESVKIPSTVRLADQYETLEPADAVFWFGVLVDTKGTKGQQMDVILQRAIDE